MLSRLCLLCLVNSGCLNSQACNTRVSCCPFSDKDKRTYLRAIWGDSIFLVLPDFVEVIFIQLANKAGKVAMLEVFRKNMLCELLVLSSGSLLVNTSLTVVKMEGCGWAWGPGAHLQYNETCAVVSPSNDVGV